ncbi:hypothetical protein SKAU_G00076760 [Synaphobranchus kaupii]|uniref:Uncharacterized protein n=1 Tax=Synaphobranchus kaupii TaxID=118154 RepID=A0A9Q1G8B9_SYNKA|nr:hypothetical protein SKAU_G00076760 [Synaphobranchus kaupii]
MLELRSCHGCTVAVMHFGRWRCREILGSYESVLRLHCTAPLRSGIAGEDMKTELVMDDSTDYSGVELRSSLIKSEDIEESIERKNGYGVSREEKPILSNIKEEEEEGGERQGEEVKREDGVKDEEVERNDWNPEIEGDEQREGNVMDQTPQTDRKSDLKQEEKSLPSLVTSCLLEQSRVPSPGSPVISSREENTGKSEVFACSQCPFAHMEEVKLHQHIEKVHPEAHSRILRPQNPAVLLWVNLLNVLVELHFFHVSEWALGAGKHLRLSCRKRKQDIS